METPDSAPVLVLGEMLWDALPRGLFLGGAPLNVGVHLRRLGLPVAVATRVGADRLGTEALRRVRAAGVAADLVQVDPERETGFVEVALDADGIPTYRIGEGVAWDALEPTDALLSSVPGARAVVFGTLAQRTTRSRETIRAVWAEACTSGVPLVYDVNLRPQVIDRDLVAAGLAVATLAKLNTDELDQARAWWGLPEGVAPAAEALAERFEVATVCVSRGADGALLVHAGSVVAHPGIPTEVADTVGAGDAFLAALLAGLLRGHAPATALDAANRLGAFVASRPGATPSYDPAAVLAAEPASAPASHAL